MTFTDQRNCFEDGCLCLLTGRMLKWTKHVSDEKAVEYYMKHCVCSRHPEGTDNKNYNADAEKAMRAVWSAKRKGKL